MLTKNQISKILSNVHFDSTKEDIISNGSVKNIVVFDKEIVIDLEILKPTLQAKNTIKRKITDSLKNNIDFNIDVKINFILISEKEPTIYIIQQKKLKTYLILLQYHLEKVGLENLLLLLISPFHCLKWDLK